MFQKMGFEKLRITMSYLFVCITAILLLGYSLYNLLCNSDAFGYKLEYEGWQMLIVELVVWGLISFWGIRKGNLLWLVAVLVIFSYLHMMMLPMLLGGLYLSCIYLVGKQICDRCKVHYQHGMTGIRFFAGFISVTVLFCVMSLLQCGGIEQTQILIIILGIVCGLCNRDWKKRLLNLWSRRYVSKKDYTKCVGILLFCLIMIGKSNLSLDYDSMWYGIRAKYALCNENSIYDNYSLIGVVYTYSKGFEVLTLPLSNMNSYGFIYAVNIIITVMILFVAYKIGRMFLNKTDALWIPLLLVSVPGITNMGITAKPDSITLLIQVMMLYYVLCSLVYNQNNNIVLISLFMYSLTLKNTAIIFSGSLLGVYWLVCLLYRVNIMGDKKGRCLLGIAFIDVFLIWLRTYLLTGSLETGLIGTILGFEKRYPFGEINLNPYAGNIQSALVHLKAFFLGCYEKSADHIFFAWGTTLCTFLVIMSLIFVWRKSKPETICQGNVKVFMTILLIVELLGAILMNIILTRPDGNYFMLYYGVIVICGLILLSTRMDFKGKMIRIILSVFILSNIIISSLNSWASTCSFTDINWINRGYYNHRNEIKKEMIRLSSWKIYDMFSEDEKNRVYAFGQQPNILLFPCIVYCDHDTTYWGNIDIAQSVELFAEYIELIDCDYVYIDKEHVTKNSDKFDRVCYLFELSMVEDMYIEDNKIVLSIGEHNGNKELYEKFMNEY